MSDATSSSSSSTQLRDHEVLLVVRDVATLESLIIENLGFALPEVRRAIARFGAGRCERSYFKTVRESEDGGIHNPRGWFVSTLTNGMEWTVEETKEWQAWIREGLAE